MLAGTNANELRCWILDVGGLLPYKLLGHILFGYTEKQLSRQDRQRAEAFLRMQAEKGLRGRLWQITEFFNELLFRLPAIRQGEEHAAHGNQVFLYYWNYPSSLPNLKACHAVELAYVFNNLHETIYTGSGANKTLAEQVQRMWINFAKTGNPSIDGEGMLWKPYSRTSRNIMILDDPIHLEKDWKERERECLSPLLTYHFNGNSNVPPINFKSILQAVATTTGARVVALLHRLFHKDRPNGGH